MAFAKLLGCLLAAKRSVALWMLGWAVMTLVTAAVAGAASGPPMIDPDLRARANAGRVRVLVQLNVDDVNDPTRRAEAIASAQDWVLARLPQTHAFVIRRYNSIPMLALEIDAQGLHALEAMTDIVVSVKRDRSVRTQ